MFRKISAVLLSFLLVWYAAEQDRDEKGKTNDTSGIAVYAPLHNEVLGEDGEEICGQVRLTAVLRSKKSSSPVRVDFILEGSSDVYRQSVEITEESLDERDFYCATAVFSNLKSGVYTAWIEQAQGAQLDYILSEDSDAAQSLLLREKIMFEIHHAGRLSSAEFFMEEVADV
ncbi:MAG: hypothetical protein J6C51_09220 [Clostridia bacterium]|nr:hypothetical protein [Clostridia bacterium]